MDALAKALPLQGAQRAWAKRVATRLSFISTRDLSANWASISDEQAKRIEDALIITYFEDDAAYLATADGYKDLQEHLHSGLAELRRLVIPWINAQRKIRDLRILEIGCGTGSSHLAFAEQGARITSIDINTRSLAVARLRVKAHGFTDNNIIELNVTEVDQAFGEERFDLVVFSESLEHMTFDEKIEGIRKTWGLLRSGALWCVYLCPNRLWYDDTHTSLLPYFNWLPDDVAYHYSKHSRRAKFNTRYRERTPENMVSFLREGRGVSFHEFDLALGDADAYRVVSSLPLFLRARAPVFLLKHVLSFDRRFESVLRRISPAVHRGFLQPYLSLLLEKP